MKKHVLIITVILSSSIFFMSCSNKQKALFKEVETKNHSAVIPVIQTEVWAVEWWKPRHEAINKRLKEGNVDLLFIGNSITHGWENIGIQYWNKYFKPLNAVNMGFGGDRTQHVLWRLEHSDFENISPKLTVLMIGTNNSNYEDNTAVEIADGIIKICKVLRTELPETKILLLAIFPRDSVPTLQREKNATASTLASKIADNKTIYYLDINNHFLTEEGILTRDIMYDYLHPTEKGYRIWAEAIEPEIIKIMGK